LQLEKKRAERKVKYRHILLCINSSHDLVLSCDVLCCVQWWQECFDTIPDMQAEVENYEMPLYQEAADVSHQNLICLGYALAGELLKNDHSDSNGNIWKYIKSPCESDLSFLIESPVCYFWVAGDKLIYVGETGKGITQRTNTHARTIYNPRPGHVWSERLSETVIGCGASRIQVYCATSPLFFNSIVRPELRLYDTTAMGMNKPTRLCEESTIVQYLKPVFNKQ
jgi:hypothetical protein